MNKVKLTSIIIASLLILSTLTFVPSIVRKASANPGVNHSVSMSPMTKILDTLPKNVDYWVNVTSSGGDFINKTCIKLPTGWTNRTFTGTPGYGFSVSATNGWMNFTTTNTDFNASAIANFSIPVTISMIPTVGTWKIYCYHGTTPSDANPISKTVTVNLKFSSTMSPNYVKNGTSYIYTITTTNDEAAVGMNKVNLTFPAGTWNFNELVEYSPGTWTVLFDSSRSTFKLSGPNVLKGNSVMIKVNMTTPVGATTKEYYWNASAWDGNNNYLGNYSMKAVVDASKPTVAFTAPAVAYYSVGFGNYIWINTSVTDTPSIATYGITVAINDTARFELHSYEKVGSTQYKYFFVNKTAISDGKLAVKVTATDPAGNIGSKEKSATIDNTAPTPLWVKVMDVTGTAAELPFVGGVYWMGAATTKIQINASFYNPSGASGTIYLNTTSASFNNNTLWPTAPGFDVSGSDYVTLKITLVDGASPTVNNFTATWEIKRDKVEPSAPTYSAEPICGGVVIRELNATDNVGVLKYKVYINGTASYVTVSDLNSATMKDLPAVPFAGNRSIAFSGTLVLNLTIHAGHTVNLTICTIDFGANPSNSTTYFLSIPQERWYPIKLYGGWNLISLPLVPADSTIEEVISLMLKPGLLESIWHYDAATGDWSVYSPGAPSDLTIMTDGKGYLVKIACYDVLIIQGTIQPLPPETPRAYHVVEGWNLIGYKEIVIMNASTYLSGVDYIRVYAYVNEQYVLVKPGDNMTPGLGYWVAVKTEGWIYP